MNRERLTLQAETDSETNGHALPLARYYRTAIERLLVA